MVLWRPTRPSKTSTHKRCPFHYKGLECKSRKSRNTWSNRQIWPWSTEWSRAKANRVLPKECTGHNKHPLPTTQEETLHMDITKRPTPKSDWLYSLQPKMEMFYSQQKQDQKLTVAQIMNSLLQNSDLKRVEKTTRPFRYDLHQIPYDYTVKVTNRFKGSDLIECLKTMGGGL